MITITNYKNEIMKNVLLLLVTLFTISTVSFAQPRNHRKVTRAEMDAKKVAFLSTELNLTTVEAEKFWPEYNTYDDKMHNIHKALRKLKNKLKNFEKLTIEEAYQATESVIKLEGNKTILRKEYLEKFSRILGKKKGAKVFYVEHKFKRELLRKIKNGEGGMSPPPPMD